MAAGPVTYRFPMLSKFDIPRITLVHVFHALLTVSWWLMLLGAPLAAAAMLTPWRPPLLVPVRVPDGAVPHVDEVIGHVDASTLADGAGVAVVALWLASAFAWLPVVWLLRSLTRSVLREGPFRETAVRLLPQVGGAFIGIALVQAYLDHAMSRIAAGDGLDAIPITPSGALVLAGFAVIGLGEVFRHGQTLQRNEDMTV